MVQLFGQRLTRREVAERAGMLSQLAGVRLMTLDDGLERGIRLLEFRTGSGLRFTCMVDRALDIADCEYKGQAIGWHSPAGFRHPGLHENEGEGGFGFLRSMSGLITTCGLDHALAPAEVPADQYKYDSRKTVKHALHGRIGFIPARLTGYGETWRGDDCVLWAEGVVQQSTLYGEDLYLVRRIEADVGGSEIRLHDRVVNHGFYRTPHMFFYHVNVGYPAFDEASRLIAPIRDVVWAVHDGPDYAAQGVGYQTSAPPRNGFREQVWEYETAADADGQVTVAVVNDRLAFGFSIETRKNQLPCLYHWQNVQAGQYVTGIEPATHHIIGDPAARERGEMIWLEHDEDRRYDTTFRVLDGAAAIAAAETRNAAIVVQPNEAYPVPSGIFTALPGRS